MKPAVLAITILLVNLTPTMADWLVPYSGQPIETAGGWHLQGTAVVFRSPNGSLYLLPSREVDWTRTKDMNLHPARRAVGRFVATNGLEIGDQLTLRWVVGAMVGSHRKQLAGPAVQAKKTKPRLVLTDADVAHVIPRVSLPVEQFPIEWRRSFEAGPEELLIVGTVTNQSESAVSSVQVEMQVLKTGGKLLRSQRLDLKPPTLPSGESGEFQYLLGPEEFSELAFSATGSLGRANR